MNLKCDRCVFNKKSPFYRPQLISAFPAAVKKLFECNSELESGDENVRQKLCAADLWVLAFIGVSDILAIKLAGETLDLLVALGNSELLCNLFENADYETRRKLWLRMVNKHSKRLYLFDAIFERDELAPIEPGITPDDLHHYQYLMLMGHNFSASVANSL